MSDSLPICGENTLVLTALSKMQSSPYYAVRWDDLKLAAQTIMRLELERDQLLAVALEISNDPKCDLVNSERRIRLYTALRIAGVDARKEQEEARSLTSEAEYDAPTSRPEDEPVSEGVKS